MYYVHFEGMAESEEATGIVYTACIPPTTYVLPAEVSSVQDIHFYIYSLEVRVLYVFDDVTR